MGKTRSLKMVFEIIKKGKIIELWKKTLIMSNQKEELITNKEFIEAAKGKVLIAGLGIGFVHKYIIDKCKSILVIEKERGIIDLYENPAPGKIKIIEADIMNWTPEERFDCIYLDIWTGMKEYEKEAQLLINKFTPFLKPGGWIGYWKS